MRTNYTTSYIHVRQILIIYNISVVFNVIGSIYSPRRRDGRGGSRRADVCDNAFHAYLKRHHNYTCEPSDNREAHITHQRVQAAVAATSVASLVLTLFTLYTYMYCTPHTSIMVTLPYCSVLIYDINIYKIYAAHRH